MNVAALALASTIVLLQDPGPPPLLPSGSLPWPVPDFTLSLTIGSITVGDMPNSTGYAAIEADISGILDDVQTPIDDLTDLTDSANLPDASAGFDTIMLDDPITGSPVSAQAAINDSATRVAMPFSYARTAVVWTSGMTSEFPGLTNIVVLLAALLVNTFLHFLVLFIRFLWGALGAALNLADRVAKLIAEVVPG